MAKKVKKLYKVLYSRTGGIRDIIDPENGIRTEPLKRALNMFIGQPREMAKKRGLNTYILACIKGNESVIANFHYKWNHPEIEENYEVY